ncbi:hypothetical protein RB195_000715 [Necator americanus]|uniref:SPIN90/Ldb17 leucine-rich domain-containing protein n=1 Tax=Necator americanus TaxID=51031 RepID=A0ABR1DCD4_NECAM
MTTISVVMYERVLNEGQIATDIVDAIRSTTDAPLSSCIEAARNCIAVMAPFIQGDSFLRIQEAVNSYTVKVDDCYDYRLLTEMKELLEQIFKEKYELSFSTEQDDDILLKYLQMFASGVTKTDPLVVKYLISMDDFQWMDHLINVYHMDQNNAVRLASLRCIVSLVDVCSDLLTYILNSRLPEIVATQFQSEDSKETPPLHHFEIFDVSMFMKLLNHIQVHPSEIMDFIVNFNGILGDNQRNTIVAALIENPCPFLGQLLVKVVNDQTTGRRLKLLKDIIAQENLYSQLFYRNDLDVLSHILARELINSENKTIRSQCMECISRLAEMGHCDERVREAVENSNFNDDLRSKTLAVIEKNMYSGQNKG